MRFVIGSDEHDPLLGVIELELRSLGHEVTRVGAKPDEPAPWGNVAVEIGERVARGDAEQGVVCCYTGTGVSMAANKVAAFAPRSASTRRPPKARDSGTTPTCSP